ncbi:hypothetical protein AAA799P11_00540 [Marine Group I thaumarchaeote SCGC AAA799-P11]|uniref:Uncharacterized protein n=1 Tax=Marine Group I thaumarchaeote SCGC AAA799-P11 TaxID=1502295 RepID=A0A087S1E7_9ARCH|nr:hypothetical protein AAA799P11_00540 [Marine Group I thaumarchaeote SCGC AAA799-P11]
MKNYSQTYGNSKLQKLFDTCKLEGRWKRMDDSLPRCYVSLEDGAAISLSMLGVDYSESFIFKKNSKIVVKDSVAEFFEDDLLR